MNGTIMSLFHCSKCLARTDSLILFILTLSSIILRLNAFSNNTPQFEYNKEMSTHDAAATTADAAVAAANNNNNNNRFRSIRQVLYNTAHIHQNETFRWHKINSNILKYRVKRKTKPTEPKASQSSRPIASQITKDGRNNSTNMIDFSNNKQIHETLTFIDLNMLLNQRSINNISDILVLNLSENVIKQIDANILKSLENVRRLDLSQNQISVLNVNTPNSQLQWLSVSENQLVSFNGQHLSSLKFLDLSCNNIVNSSHIQINELNELECLDLSGNQLNIIQRHVFEKSIKLKVVNLSYNRLASINMDIFRDLSNIEGLDLSYNQITFIDNDSFSHLSKLQYLDLSYNLIDASSLRAVQGIPNLIKLSIAFNTKLGDALQGFISSWSLKELDMSGIGLCEIPNALAQSVHTLNISSNNFAVIRCGDLDSYPLLQHLDVSSCQISDIEDDALGRLDLLLSLHLNNNNITHVPSSLPVNLVRLFLQNNRIADIQASAFSHLVNLEVVNLSGNQITYLPSLPLPRLLILDLRSTRLKRLSQSIIKMSPRLKVVFLDGNPIKCTELQGIAEWATPCRIDDSFELIYTDDEPDASLNYDDDDLTNYYEIRPKQCRCKTCQLSDYPVAVDKSQCSNTRPTISNRTHSSETIRMPLNVKHLIKNESKTKSYEKLTDTFESKKSTIAMEIAKNTPVKQRQKLLNVHKSERMNDTNLPIDHDIQSISVTGSDRSAVEHVYPSTESFIYTSQPVTPTDYLDSSKLTTKRDVKLRQFNKIINTNGNSNPSRINDNTFMVDVMKMTTDKMSDMVENLSNKDVEVLHPNSISFGDNSLTDARYGIKDTSIWYDKLENSNIAKLLTPQMPAEAHITKLIPETTTVAASREFTSNSVETLSTFSDDGNIEINYEHEQLNRHPKYNDSDHKENKSKVNWNINKAISRTNDMASLQQARNISISDIHRGSDSSASNDNVRHTIHINEINKNQLTERNQMVAKYGANDIVSRVNELEASHRHYMEQNYSRPATLTKGMVATTKKMPTDQSGNEPNVKIVYSNSSTENGMLINDTNNNDHQRKYSGHGSNETASIARKNVVHKNQQNHEQNPASMQMHKEIAVIEQTKLLSVLSPILKANQELDNGMGTTISANITGHAFKRDYISLRKEANKTTAIANGANGTSIIDNGNASNVNTTVDGYNDGSNNDRTQQINNTATFAIETNGKEKPLIGRLSQNVSIIDNEQQFERHNNSGHSTIEQKTLERTTTKLQSLNDNVQASSEDRYDNRKGSISNISDNSTVHAVAEQWHDKCATSGHSGLFVAISIGISVLVTFYLVYVYRCKNLYYRNRIETMEPNRQAQNLLIAMQMETLSSKLHYTDTPIDLW